MSTKERMVEALRERLLSGEAPRCRVSPFGGASLERDMSLSDWHPQRLAKHRMSEESRAERLARISKAAGNMDNDLKALGVVRGCLSAEYSSE